MTSWTRNLRGRKRELLRQKKDAEEKRASAERELHAAELETTRAEEREENLQKAVQKGEEQIAKLLAETSFPDAAAAESLYMRRDKAALQAEIEAYDRECAAVAAAIAALTAEGEIAPVGEEEFAAASARFEAQGRQREELGRQAAVAASRIGQYEAALQQKKGAGSGTRYPAAALRRAGKAARACCTAINSWKIDIRIGSPTPPRIRC